MVAHRQAWEIAHILHGDISPNNLLIDIAGNPETGEREGFLCDWDLCQYEEDSLNGPSQLGGRSVSSPIYCKTLTYQLYQGTWQYMSALLLQYPLKPTRVSDDIESFLNLCVRFGARFIENDCSQLDHEYEHRSDELAQHNERNDSMCRFVDNFFNACGERDGYVHGGEHKKAAIDNGASPLKFTRRGGEEVAISILINSFYKLVQEHYRAIDYSELAKFSPWPVEMQSKPTVPKASVLPPAVWRMRNEGKRPIPQQGANTTPFMDPCAIYRRVLDTHEAVRELLLSCADLDWAAEDKTVDQFYGLAVLKHVGDCTLSASSTSSSQPSTADSSSLGLEWLA